MAAKVKGIVKGAVDTPDRPLLTDAQVAAKKAAMTQALAAAKARAVEKAAADLGAAAGQAVAAADPQPQLVDISAPAAEPLPFEFDEPEPAGSASMVRSTGTIAVVDGVTPILQSLASATTQEEFDQIIGANAETLDSFSAAVTNELRTAAAGLTDEQQAREAVQSTHSDESIKKQFAAAFTALVAGAGLAIPLAGPLSSGAADTFVPLIVSAALGTRSAINLFSIASKQLGRKITEVHTEQPAPPPSWTEFAKGRVLKYGPKSGFDPARFEGPDGIREVSDDAIAAIAYLRDKPLDLDAGETSVMRDQFQLVLASLLQGTVAAKTGLHRAGLNPPISERPADNGFPGPRCWRMSWA